MRPPPDPAASQSGVRIIPDTLAPAGLLAGLLHAAMLVDL